MKTLALEPRAARVRVARLWSGLPVDTIAQVAVYALAAVFVAGFFVAALFRLTYSFALQMTEPASLTQVERILRGQSLYVAPSLEFVPMIYGPVYFYLAAAVAMLVGPTYAPLRLVSLVASLVTMAIIGRLVQRETGSLGSALVAAGLYAACFPFSETGHDLGRVDALFTMFLVAAIYAVRRADLVPGQIGRSLAAGGVLLALAAFTKVPLGALPVGLALLISTAFAHRLRGAGLLLLAALGITATGFLMLFGANGAWPIWYMWTLPQQHALRPNLISRFWFADLLPRFTIALLFGPVFALVRLLQRDARPLVFYSMVAGSVLTLSWLSRANAGGALNVLLPAFALAAILLGIGLDAAVAEIRGPSKPARAFRAYLLGLCLVQFALLAYNPRITVPHRSDQWADERLAATLAALPGPIFAGDLDGYVHGAVDSDHPMIGPIGELQGEFGGDGSTEGRAIHAELGQRFAEHRYRYVVMLQKGCCISQDPVAYGYRDLGPLFPPGDVFYEWKSWRTPAPELYAAPEQN